MLGRPCANGPLTQSAPPNITSASSQSRVDLIAVLLCCWNVHCCDYRPSCAIVARSGAFETWISPSYGAYISRIRKIAPDTDRAETSKLAITVAFEGASRPKLRKITVSQSTRMTSMGREIDVVACSYIN